LIALLLFMGVGTWNGFVWAQAPARVEVASLSGKVGSNTEEKDIAQWLRRLNGAAWQSAYVGTFVVAAGESMSSARIWHVCEDRQQMERVETLSGPARTTFRRNDQVVTFFPDSRVVISETREALGFFPHLLGRADSSISQFYRLKILGRERVAGLEAEVVQLVPADTKRFGYRVWAEEKKGLVVKQQTLDRANAVLEQAAFSELKMGESISFAKLSELMNNTAGYEVRSPELIKTTAEQEGWLFKGEVAGFKPMSCNKRVNMEGTSLSGDTLQCVFSDGLASVSLFIETFETKRHNKLERYNNFAVGATRVLTRRLGSWWLTAVGEVPESTLAVFAQGIERKK
jgi:sigma-E factor negative regulatory protein RseB